MADLEPPAPAPAAPAAGAVGAATAGVDGGSSIDGGVKVDRMVAIATKFDGEWCGVGEAATLNLTHLKDFLDLYHSMSSRIKCQFLQALLCVDLPTDGPSLDTFRQYARDIIMKAGVDADETVSMIASMIAQMRPLLLNGREAPSYTCSFEIMRAKCDAACRETMAKATKASAVLTPQWIPPEYAFLNDSLRPKYEARRPEVYSIVEASTAAPVAPTGSGSMMSLGGAAAGVPPRQPTVAVIPRSTAANGGGFADTGRHDSLAPVKRQAPTQEQPQQPAPKQARTTADQGDRDEQRRTFGDNISCLTAKDWSIYLEWKTNPNPNSEPYKFLIHKTTESDKEGNPVEVSLFVKLDYTAHKIFKVTSRKPIKNAAAGS